jgi:16S rRNA (guanine966-N2)-methyltransferase
MTDKLFNKDKNFTARVISGIYKGKKLYLPINFEIVRPTTDRVKELLFNILLHNFNNYLTKDTIMLDAFCGSGSLGIEALSRGVGGAIFVDEDKQVLHTAIDNVKSLYNYNDIAKNIVFFHRSIFKLDLKTILGDKKIKLVFLDPPYVNTNFINNFYTNFLKDNIFTNDCLFISLSDNKDLIIEGLDCIVEKSTTKTIIKFFKLK